MSTSKSETSFTRLLFRIGFVTAVALAIIRFTLGQKPLEKIATDLAMPCGLIWYLLICGVVLSLGAQSRKLTAVMFLTWLAFTVLGSGYLSTWMANELESPFAQIDPLKQQPFDYVIVLGGGASQGVNGRQQGNSSGDRLILAAQLYHAGIAGNIICTGKKISEMTNSPSDPAERSADILAGLGVPTASIELVGGRTTSEEMKTLGARFGESQQRIGLITSAWHIKRALRLAKYNGLTLHPLPADFLGGEQQERTTSEKIQSLIPNAMNLFTVSRIAKEHLAALVGR